MRILSFLHILYSMCSLGTTTQKMMTVLSFNPRIDESNSEQMLKTNAIQLPRLNNLPPKPLMYFSICFRYKLDSLTPHLIFNGKGFVYYLRNPFKRYGIINWGKEHSLLFYFSSEVKPAFWNKMCIIKKPNLEINGTELLIFHNDASAIVINIHNSTFQVSSRTIQDLVFGGLKGVKLYTHGRSMVFRGKMSGVIGISRAILKKELHEYIYGCKNDLPGVDLLNLTPFNITDPNTTVSLQQVVYTSICKSDGYYDRINFPNSNPMTWQETKEVCYLINGIVSFQHEKKKQVFLWTDMRKDPDDGTVFSYHSPNSILRVGKIKWEQGQPDGGEDEECIAYSTRTGRYFDHDCNHLLDSQCEPRYSKYFVLRGICQDGDEIEADYYIEDLESDEGFTLVFTGFEKNNIVKRNKSWIITSEYQKDKILGIYNGSKEYPVGINDWYITGYCNAEYHVLRKVRLNFSKCHYKREFTCNNGDCISLVKRCDEISDCDDGSDEEHCEIIWLLNYRKEFPPSKLSDVNKFRIQVELLVLKIRSIDEKNNKLSLDLEIKLRWQDIRVFFLRLNPDSPSILTEEEKNLIWVPMLIFENSADSTSSIIVDRQSEISITRDSNAVEHMAGTEYLHESTFYYGESAYFHYKRQYEVLLHCHLKFERYPFDSQICKIEIVLPYLLTEAFELELADGKWTTKLIDSNLDGLQFYLTDLYTFINSTHKSKIISHFRFKRIYTNVLTTVFVPTLCLQFIVLLTLHIKEERFNTVVMVTLTAALATYTLYQSISNSLPSTSYIKMIDNWLLFSLLMPFMTFFIVMSIERFSYLARDYPKNQKTYIKHKKELIFYGKFGIVFLTVMFDIVYWYVNLCIYYID